MVISPASAPLTLLDEEMLAKAAHARLLERPVGWKLDGDREMVARYLAHRAWAAGDMVAVLEMGDELAREGEG